MSSNIFSSVSRVAIRSIVEEHVQPSKYGFFLTEQDLDNLVANLVDFLATSRSLKESGDRLIQSQVKESQKPKSKFRQVSE